MVAYGLLVSGLSDDGPLYYEKQLIYNDANKLQTCRGDYVDPKQEPI